jgi:hypothetical protein
MREELKLAKDIGRDEGFAKGFFLGIGVAFISCIIALIIVEKQRIEPIDVYRGKTTLEITYRDSVAIDSTVVYKVR